jgi:hypothetical protein
MGITDLKNTATSRFDSAGNWTRGDDSSSKLFEVWQTNDGVEYHPSRNRFFHVTDPQTKKHLCKIALGSMNKRAMFSSGHSARERRGKSKKKEPVKEPKDPMAPHWAKPENVIGYTSSQEIKFIGERVELGGLTSYPSIYFKGGHCTIDHSKPGNPGWDNKESCRRLFFGNIPGNVDGKQLLKRKRK